MITKVLRFSEMLSQHRWKVEFFCSNGAGSKCTACPLVALQDVLVERRESLDPQQLPNQLFNYLGLEHVEPLTGDLVRDYEPKEGRSVLSRSKVFRDGDILYGRLRPSLNKVFVADDTLPEGICSGEFYVLIPDSKRLLPHFARSLLASRYVQDVVKGMTTGSALPRLQLGDLLEIQIPLPPLEVQHDFEAKLIAQKAKRQKLSAELFDGPAAELNAVVNALEQGTLPDFTTTAEVRTRKFQSIKLPDGAATAGRGRGRPSGPKIGQLQFEMT